MMTNIYDIESYRMTIICDEDMLVIRGGNRAGRVRSGRAKTGSGQNWLDFFEPKF